MSDDDLIPFKTKNGYVYIEWNHEICEVYDSKNKVRRRIGTIRCDEESFMLLEADINKEYQKMGIASKCIETISKGVGRLLLGHVHDGHSYDDGRHLSIEGAALVSRMVEKKYMRWDEEIPDNDDF